MRELRCTECGRSAREGNGLYELARYPTLRICWHCTRNFQRWIIDNMGPEYVSHPLPLWLRDFVMTDGCWPTKDSLVYELIPAYPEIGK